MKVSICCITYNHEKFLKQAFDGFLMQDFDDYEIIVSDDCSKDETVNILKEYKALYPDKISLILNEYNIGVMPNFTQALLACKGDYISLCEGDDYWIDSLKLKKQVEILDQNPQYSMVFSNRIIVDANSKQKGISNYAKEVYSITDIVNGFIPATQTILFRRNKELGNFFSFQNEKYSGDRTLSFYCSLFGNIYRMQEATAAYRDSGSGVWSSFSIFKQIEHRQTHLIKFHRRIGFPIENPVFAFKAIDAIVELLILGFKDPRLFFSKKIYLDINKIWYQYRYMNRFKLLRIVLTKKIKKKFK